jgi:hypothetical protein
LRAAPALACAAALLGSLWAAAAAHAEDEDRAQSQFIRPAAATPRNRPASTQAEALEWERRLRPPERYGPPPLRPADAALLAAARAAQWAEVAQLLKSGQAAANARDATGGHALVVAARAGQDDLVRELLGRGAEIDRVGEDGFTALGAAAFGGRRSTVRLLVLAGADVERWGATGQTALHLASLAGQMGVLEELLRLHVNVELLNRQRESALDVAAAAGQQDAMGHLIMAGADAQLAGQR